MVEHTVIPVLRKQRQKDHKFETMSCPKIKKKKKKWG
jgi:hypothetical protein